MWWGMVLGDGGDWFLRACFDGDWDDISFGGALVFGGGTPKNITHSPGGKRVQVVGGERSVEAWLGLAFAHVLRRGSG